VREDVKALRNFEIYAFKIVFDVPAYFVILKHFGLLLSAHFHMAFCCEIKIFGILSSNGYHDSILTEGCFNTWL
jgi:hypothetical protein